jgi:hypothetical protein
MFLPSIIELKSPRDAGPGLIINSFTRLLLGTFKNPLISIDEEQKPSLNQLEKCELSLSYSGLVRPSLLE